MKITIVSGKGGTGKTTIATNLVKLINNAFYVDMDVEEPNGRLFLKPEIVNEENYNVMIPEINEDKCNYCGLCANNCAFNALSIIKSINNALFFEDLCHHCGVCSYVCPENAIKEVDKCIGKINYGKFDSKNINFIEGVLNLNEATGTPIINGISRLLNEEKVYVLDAPPGTNCPVVSAINSADFIILAIEPTPFGVHDGELTLEIIKGTNKPCGVVINKYSNENLDRFINNNELNILGKIPFKRGIAERYSKGDLLIDMNGDLRNAFIAIIKNINKLNSREIRWKEQ